MVRVTRLSSSREEFERFEHSEFERDYRRWMNEQEAGDAMRDELQEHEIHELDRDDEQ